MADTALQTQYRQEFIATFEQRESLVRKTVTTETLKQGGATVFLVAGSGTSEAVTRGYNGLIPAQASDLNQYTCNLTEWHSLEKATGFNIFTSQGDRRRIMQMNTVARLNRRIDQDIITQLNTATQNTGAAVTATLNLVMKSKVILGNNNVRFDGNVFALITPAFEAYLMALSQFASADYVSRKPFEQGGGTETMFNWLGITWIVHSELPGVGTNAEKCFLYHKNAIGSAFDNATLTTAIGYDDEQDYSFARASNFTGSKLLQNSGIVVMNHDGSAYVSS